MATSRNSAGINRRKKRQAEAYLTKRILLSSAKAGVMKAAESTNQIMHYNVIARNGHLVKLYTDGKVEIIRPIRKAKLASGQAIVD